MKTFFFFFWRALALVSLVLGLGLEHSCPWPRECLSLERLSLALASDFFVSLALASSLVSSTPPLIFNACISTGYFPKVLKTAEVVPIFKKGERELCSNYRPISILNPFAKLFEKCLLDQLNNYFVSNNLISPNQYGFKKNCSTNEAVLDIYNKLLDNMDKKFITGTFYFLRFKKSI